RAVQGSDSEVKAFTFVTGDPRYDESPWVEQMLARTRHPWSVCRFVPADVPEWAESVQHHQDEPFGGLPTLAYAKLFDQARSEGIVVVLDGQGMDEQWAGYDYYADTRGRELSALLQGAKGTAVRADCLTAEFATLVEPADIDQPFP